MKPAKCKVVLAADSMQKSSKPLTIPRHAGVCVPSHVCIAIIAPPLEFHDEPVQIVSVLKSIDRLHVATIPPNCESYSICVEEMKNEHYPLGTA